MTTEAEEDFTAQQEARDQQVLQSMQDAGVPTEESGYVDYFGFDQTYQVDLPDGKSHVIHTVLNEGARRRYMNEVNREVRVQKVTGDAIMKMAAGDERVGLLRSAITGWNMRTRDKDGELVPVPFTKNKLSEFLDKADPVIIDLIEKDVRERNPWLLAEVTVDDIDKQIDELNEMRDKKLKEDDAKNA